MPTTTLDPLIITSSKSATSARPVCGKSLYSHGRTSIIRETTNITRITYVNNVVYNEGPQYEVIARESAQPIRRLKLERREEFEGDPRTLRAEQLRPRVEGGSLRVLALPIDTAK